MTPLWTFMYSMLLVTSSKPLARKHNIGDADGEVFPEAGGEHTRHQATLTANVSSRKWARGVVDSLGEVDVFADDYMEERSQRHATITNSEACACDGCLYNGACRSAQQFPTATSAKCIAAGGHWGGCAGCLSPSFVCRSVDRFPTATSAKCNAQGWVWCQPEVRGLSGVVGDSPPNEPPSTQAPIATPTESPTAKPTTKAPTAMPTKAPTATPTTAATEAAWPRWGQLNKCKGATGDASTPVSNQQECQALAERSGHKYYSYRTSGEKVCFTSSSCGKTIPTANSRWNIYCKDSCGKPPACGG